MVKAEPSNCQPLEERGVRRFGFLAALAWLMAVAAISTDLYLPAIPSMALGLRETPVTIQLSVASYLAGFVLGQLGWGPLGDSIGRRMPMLAGLALFVAASAGSALSISGEAIIAWRLIQGIGASACAVLSRAVVRDLYSGDDAARVLSTLLAVMALSPLLGPLLGAAILDFAGWRAIFWTLAVAGIISAYVVLKQIPEDRIERTGTAISRYTKTYVEIATDVRLLTPLAVGASFYAGLFAFLSASPQIFMVAFDFTPGAFASLLAFGTFMVIISNLINARVVRRVTHSRALTVGALIGCVFGLGSIGATALMPGDARVLIAALMGFMISGGFIVGNSVAGVLEFYPRAAATASGLCGAVQFLAGLAGSLAVSILFDGTALPLSLVLGTAGITMLIFTFLKRPGDEPVA
ncbi:multidrug effflux MFS transporter [Tsuneonella amylolytica]|uniref:multidrug effflux MFS transporter n=1 Tax=Tsuneonella amylolytica TaxID=2338327 RepID=UPI000EA919A8|nr:multidrug effflux MFS transporter [Tsuneonella amylolytica]